MAGLLSILPCSLTPPGEFRGLDYGRGLQLKTAPAEKKMNPAEQNQGRDDQETTTDTDKPGDHTHEQSIACDLPCFPRLVWRIREFHRA